jgi:hypothetical protein
MTLQVAIISTFCYIGMAYSIGKATELILSADYIFGLVWILIGSACNFTIKLSESKLLNKPKDISKTNKKRSKK